MSLPIFYIDQPTDQQVITLSEETSKHVVQVLRMKQHESLQLADGAGTILTCQIIDPHKKKCTVSVTAKRKFPPKQKQVSIAISLLKNTSRFEWFLEKATEIGVTEIIPLISDRTEKQHFRYDRMKQIVIAAMMQSQQSWLPVLQQPQTFEEVISTVQYQERLIAHCIDEQKNPVQTFKGESVQILIGPEGDFSPAEIELGLKAGLQPVSLGDTRLRTETAGVVAATLLCK